MHGYECTLISHSESGGNVWLQTNVSNCWRKKIKCMFKEIEKKIAREGLAFWQVIILFTSSEVHPEM